MGKATRYLNTDLVLRSWTDLSPLARAFEARGLFALHVDQEPDGRWRAAFETESDHEAAESNIAALLDAVADLPDDVKPLWAQCADRELSLGYDSGDSPAAFEQRLSSAILAQIAAAGTRLSITIYARDGEDSPSGAGTGDDTG